ncbi:hypothetical protein L7F22_047137 [Adiantum nelumboides]|nr:hypothetical protein [Adiantum nelumboides]
MLMVDSCQLCTTHNSGQQKQQLERPRPAAIVDTDQVQRPDIADIIITDAGDVKVDEASLFLLDSPTHTSDNSSSPPYYSKIELPSSSISLSSSFNNPSLPSKYVFSDFSDKLDDAIAVAPTANFSVSKNASIVLSCSNICMESSPPLQSVPYLPQTCSPAVAQSFCPKQTSGYHTDTQAILQNIPTDGQNLQSYFMHMLSQQAMLEELKHQQRLRTPLSLLATSNQSKEGTIYVQQPCLAANDCNLNGVAPQIECNGKSFDGYGLDDTTGLADYLNVLGNGNHKQYPNSLPRLQNLNNLSTMPEQCYSNVQDAYSCATFRQAPISNEVSFSQTHHPSMYRDPRIELASLYSSNKIKDLSLAGVEMLSDDNQHSTIKINFQPYTKEEKNISIDRYRRKRSERNFSKKIKYACRKTLADSRPRIKGRFAKTDDT